MTIFRVILFIILFTGLLTACSEPERVQYGIDKIPPGRISNVEVNNIHGGAIISYTIPDDDDLLYLKVIYTLSNGTTKVQKSSAYSSKIAVEGLGLARSQTIQIVCVDMSGNESAPYLIEINPLDAPIYSIIETVQMTEDFGGIKITWDNPLKEAIALTVYTLENKNYVEQTTVYSNSTTGKYNIRGFPAEEVTFAVSVKDRWQNLTKTVNGTFVPILEEKLENKKFLRWNPPGIPYLEFNTTWRLENLWDGKLSDPSFSLPNTKNLPTTVTFDMGQAAKLNRVKIYQRHTAFVANDQLFSGANIKRFKLFGSPHGNVNENINTWILLGEFTSIKPSGLPLGQTTNEDISKGLNGEDYIIEILHEPVRYLRLDILDLWDGSRTAGEAAEIEIFGEIQK